MLSPIRKEVKTSPLKPKSLKNTTAAGVDSSATAPAEMAAPASDTFEVALNQEQIKTTPTRTVHPVEGTLEKKVIAKLIGNLEADGQQLIDNPTLQNYSRYKNALQSLMETVLPKAYTIIKNYSPAENQQSHKEYNIIGVVSQELTSLLTLVKETHQEKIDIAAKVYEIKGMIIDYLK